MAHLSDRTLALVLGTRPEVVKLDGLRRLLGDASVIIHTGQHYDAGVAGDFYATMGWPRPHYQLDTGGLSRGVQIGRAIEGLDRILEDLKPDAVVVQGDTNAVLAGGIAANARAIPLIHVEAGLRSNDRSMPEEHNRILVDHLSDLCLAPTVGAAENLISEGIPRHRISVTGNTVIEGVNRFLPGEELRCAVLGKMELVRRNFVLATLHRPENTDHSANLESFVRSLGEVDRPIVWPVHPRLREGLYGRALPKNVKLVPPLEYREFLSLLAECAYVVTDSGGVQEEITVVGVPAIVVRRSTERPEALEHFSTLVAMGNLGRALCEMEDGLPAKRQHLTRLPSPFGDGSASKRSMEAIEMLLNDRRGT